MATNTILEAYAQGDNNWSFEQKPDFDNRGIKPTNEKLTFLASEKALKQYTDDYLYEAEVAFRKWMKVKLQDEDWCKTNWMRKYRYGQLIQEIFGRPYNPKIDGGRLTTTRMFAHYCSTVTKSYQDRRTGKKHNSACYNISVSRCRKIGPYGIRLQAEELMKNGTLPTRYNVRIKKSLKKGEARNWKTSEHLLDKQERGRKAYEKYVASQKETNR